MPYKLTLVLTPKQAADVKYYTEQAARRAGVAEQDVALVRVVGRSIDCLLYTSPSPRDTR